MISFSECLNSYQEIPHREIHFVHTNATKKKFQCTVELTESSGKTLVAMPVFVYCCEVTKNNWSYTLILYSTPHHPTPHHPTTPHPTPHQSTSHCSTLHHFIPNHTEITPLHITSIHTTLLDSLYSTSLHTIPHHCPLLKLTERLGPSTQNNPRKQPFNT